MQKPAECTTILVGKDATIDGSTMIARSEDGGSTIIPEAFIAVNPKEQPKHYKAVISGQEIDDEDLLPNPLRYTSVPDASGKNGIWAAAGINDATVAMTATETITTNSRIQGIDPLVEEGGLGKEDFVTLTLPYIHSAREGVKRLGYLVEKYGTYEMNGSAFADHDEVWYIETIGGHHWAARRIPDDAYVAAPNRLNIDFFDFNDEENFMCSSDLLDIINEYHLNPDYQATTSVTSLVHPPSRMLTTTTRGPGTSTATSTLNGKASQGTRTSLSSLTPRRRSARKTSSSWKAPTTRTPSTMSTARPTLKRKRSSSAQSGSTGTSKPTSYRSEMTLKKVSPACNGWPLARTLLTASCLSTPTLRLLRPASRPVRTLT